MEQVEKVHNPEEAVIREWRARMLGSILKTLIVLCVFYEAVAFLPGFSDNPLLGVLIMGGLLAVLVVSLVALRAGRVALASQLFLMVLLLTGVIGVVSYGGLLSSIWMVFVMLMLLAGLLAGWRSVLIYCGLGCLVLLVLILDHWLGFAGLPIHPQQEEPSALVVLFCLTVGAIFMAHALRRLDEVRRQRLLFERERTEAKRLESIGQLAGGVAHDFNNLLTAILANCEFLNGLDSLPAESRRQVRQIDEAGRRAATLTQQLLAFARRQVLEPKVIDLNAVLSDLRELLGRLIREDVELAIHTGADIPTVRADPAQIEQVVVNLAVNARDAMPTGGKLTIETDALDLDEAYCRQHPGLRPGRFAALVVSDTGQGMSAATLDRVFEPFFTTKDSRGGTGLGLATVYGIVRQSGGHVRVYSEPGRGSTFKVYLPATEGLIEERGAVVAPAGKLQGDGQLVLVVDDEALVRSMIDRILDRFGYRTLVVADGQAALEALDDSAEMPDLLITDVVMPRMGGRALADELVKRIPGLEVLYVSGYAKNAIVHSGELDAGVHFLAKPFTPTSLAEKVLEVLSAPDAPGADANLSPPTTA